MKTNNTPRAGSPDTHPHQATLALIQLNRFGDIIQTAQAIEELKKTHPNYRVVLIARTQFAKPMDGVLNKYFDHVYTIDAKKILFSSETTGLKNAIAELNSFLSQINGEKIDVLINLSFSKTSSYLASLIPSTHKIGLYQDLSNRMVINDKWSQVLYSTVMRGALNPFSLVDLFRNIIGIKPNTSTKKKLALASLKSNTIVVHPFASHERKAWKNEKWVEVIYRVLKENDGAMVQIVGAKNEVLRSQIICENPLLKTQSHRIQNLTGKTTIAELLEHLKRSRLFVGHDSMVGHLASLADTPTLTVSLGSVRPFETTPYHDKAYNLSPRTKCFPCFPTDACGFTQCHLDIPYQVVSSCVKQLFDHKELSADWAKNNISNFHASSIHLQRAQISKGQFQLEHLLDSPADTNEVFRSLYRVAWSFVIGDSEENLPIPKISTSAHKELLDSLVGLQHLFELSEFGKKYSRFILEEISSQMPSIAKIKDYSKKIDEIDHLQSLVYKTSPQLSPIVDYFAIRKANLYGDNVVKMTESSYYAFEECAHLCSIMYELIEKTISEHKLSTGKSTRPETNK